MSLTKTKHSKAVAYLLHGWAVDPNNKKKWLPLIAELEKLGVEAKFIGLPGLTIPLNQVWKLNDYQDWLAKQLPKEPVILFGHSFGGQLAARFAATNPTRVNKLILMDSAGLRDHSVLAKVKRGTFWAVAKGGKLIIENQLARKWLYRLAREKDYYSASPILRKTMSNVVEDEVWSDLKKIKAKTLIIWGKKDRITPLKLAHYFNQFIKNSRLEIIDEGRHAPHFSHPAVVAKLVAGSVFEN